MDGARPDNQQALNELTQRKKQPLEKFLPKTALPHFRESTDGPVVMSPYHSQRSFSSKVSQMP